MDAARIAAVGKFDALHRGHRSLVASAARLGRPLVLTFAGMAEVLGWEPRLPIVPAADRSRIFERWSRELGVAVEHLELPFAEIRECSPAAFVDLLRDAHGVGGIVTGANFRFGRDRSGDAEQLAALCAARGLAAEVAELVAMEGGCVSSSRVRAALAAGEVPQVTALLDRPHRVLGTVERGDGRGRQLGFPTANCARRLNLAPGPGVYAARAWLDGAGPIPAAVNVGRLPTVGADRPLTVEAHLIGWDGDCYDAAIGLDLIARLRDEQRFDSLAALRTQIAADVARARDLLGA